MALKKKIVKTEELWDHVNSIGLLFKSMTLTALNWNVECGTPEHLTQFTVCFKEGLKT